MKPRAVTRWPRFAAGLVALAAVGQPSDLHAQFRLLPQLGMYAPASELPPLGEATEFGKRQSTLALGLAIELGPSLRVGVLHGTGGDIPFDAVGCEDCTARSTVSSLTATLVVRPLPRLAMVQPFLLLGGGVKRYDFDREDLQNEGVNAALSDANDVTGHLGLGAELSLGGFRLLVELQDLVSNFDPDVEGVDASFQHDLFLTVGLPLGR